jgi:hypothetical protein
MAKQSKSKAKGDLTNKQKGIRDIGVVLDSICLDWKDLSKKPLATLPRRRCWSANVFSDDAHEGNFSGGRLA